MKSESLRERWRQWRNGIALLKYQKRLEIAAQKPPPPMPSLRRTLTVVDITGPDLAFPRLINQVNSALFNRLPLDIRKLIYECLIRDKCFHIVRKGKRLAYLLCQAQTPGSHERDGCWGYENGDGTFDSREDFCGESNVTLPWDRNDRKARFRTDGGLLPLLLSCRRVYCEAVETLYHHNQFCFTDETTWALFCSTIPSHRLSLVQSLHIQLISRNIMAHPIGRNEPPQPDYFSKEEYWIKFWESVGNLEGLRLLEVKLVEMPQFCYHRFSLWSDRTWHAVSAASERDEEFRDVLLDPLRKIKGLDGFVVELPYFHGVRDGDPFTVSCPKWTAKYR